MALFKNDIPGFLLEERTVPEYWWSEDPEHDPWECQEIITRCGEIAHSKLFDKNAGFISKEWMPYFVNYRRDGYVAMDTVILRDGDGQEISMEIPDKELYDKSINEGDWVYFDVNDQVFKDK